MSALTLTVAREVRKNLQSAKGIAMVVLFLLGGLAPARLRALFTQSTEGIGLDKMGEEGLHTLKIQVLTQRFKDENIAKYLADCPTTLLGLFEGTLFFLPPIILLIGFDAICGETQHRTLRYLVNRAPRPTIVAGKMLGIWGVVAAMTLLLNVAVWVVALVQKDGTAAQMLSWGGRLWVLSVVYAGAYVGLTTLLSALFRTPAVALVTGVAVLFAMGILNLTFGFIESTHSLTYLFPSTYEKWLLSPDPGRIAAGCGVLLAWAATCLLGATELVRRRDA
jgi:ABC-type transport system involved in multi-copper enzyme maturation permease subunit